MTVVVAVGWCLVYLGSLFAANAAAGRWYELSILYLLCALVGWLVVRKGERALRARG